MNQRPSDSVAKVRALLAGAALMLAACGTTAAVPAASSIIDTVAIGLPPTTATLASIVTTADATAPATRMTTSTVRVEQAAPVDPCGPVAQHTVNTLPYAWGNKAATTEAYRIVATCRGWTQATQDFYRAGIIDDIFVGESAQCPWHRGWQRVEDDCTPIETGRIGEDAGLWMITAAGWGPGGLVCIHGGYCSPQSIVATAWDSMNAGLLLVEHAGKFPWTWDADACAYHRLVCNTWPREWSNS